MVFGFIQDAVRLPSRNQRSGSPESPPWPQKKPPTLAGGFLDDPSLNLESLLLDLVSSAQRQVRLIGVIGFGHVILSKKTTVRAKSKVRFGSAHEKGVLSNDVQPILPHLFAGGAIGFYSRSWSLTAS
jgi:hypothetical protein